MKLPENWLRVLLTSLVVLVAVVMLLLRYRAYLHNPWTRDGQVRANVIQIAARVSGPIVSLPIVDNQFVQAGEPLFEIDPRTYRAALAEAEANLDRTRDQLQNLTEQVKATEAALAQSGSRIDQARSAIQSAQAQLVQAEADYDRATRLVERGNLSRRSLDEATAAQQVAQANLSAANARLLEAEAARTQAQAELARARAERGAPGEDNAQLRAAVAAVEQARLNLEFTRVRAPVDGYVTNLELRLGSQVVANQPALALVDVDSFWVHGFFRETVVSRIQPGHRSVVTLMGYPDIPLVGRVDSIGWGIAQSDGSTGANLLPQISPTFEWIRLAQRVPVKVVLETVPENVQLRVGTTASVLVMTDSDAQAAEVPGVPVPLQ